MASGKPMAELVEEQENGSLVLAIETPVESIARRAGTVFTTTGAYTAAPFRAIRPQTWVFKGTELRRGSLFGASSANYPIAASFNRGPISGDGASGLFTAKIAPGSSKFVRLARGENPTGAADMVYRDTDSGGWIFNASSETFLGSAPRDPAVTQILLNLLNNAAEPHHGQ
jgi:hypothetical protein